MTRIEFRLLQLILSPVSGDRLTLALLHWDGHRLRIASSSAPLSTCDRAHREGIRVALDDAMRRAAKASEENAEAPRLDLGLANVLPVREGMGTALHWGPVVTVEARDPEAHFAMLRHQLRLDREPSPRRARVTAQGLRRKLSAIGEKLREDPAARESVRTDCVVADRQSFAPPLSWKNGRWHHAVPVSFDGLDRDEMDAEVQRVYGLVELAFPEADVPVVVAALPRDAAARELASTDAELLRTSLAAREVELVVPERRGGLLAFDDLVARVRKDTGAEH